VTTPAFAEYLHPVQIAGHDSKVAGEKVVDSQSVAASCSEGKMVAKLDDARNAFEAQYLNELMECAWGSVQNAALLCDQPVNVVYRLLRKHKIKCSKFRKLH